jgi:hypothetical protein
MLPVGISDPGYNVMHRRRNIVDGIASGSVELTARRDDAGVGSKKKRAKDRTPARF